MQKINISTFLSFAHYIADIASEELIRDYKKKNLNQKKKIDISQILTKTDKKIEKLVRAQIKKEFPYHNIIGEEYGKVQTKSPYSWIIDPIDGTKAFLSGVPVFTFLLSLKYKEDFILGMVDQPIIKERFWSINKKSYCNDKVIKTKKCKKLSDAIIAITDPMMFSNYKVLNKKVFNNLNYVRWGTDALGYVRCAEGIIDGVIERNINIWDVAAVEPIIRNAGGVISTWDGKKIGSNDTICATGDKIMHSILVNTLQNYI